MKHSSVGNRVLIGLGLIARPASILIGVLLLFLSPPGASAYERYNDGCQDCHGAFTDSTSPKGSIIVPNKHNMHRSGTAMATECDLCHTDGDGDNPFLGSSNGTSINPGYGCSGCHGRMEDMGHDTLSTGRGAGLRQYHWTAGEQVCGDCHTDADPAVYTPVGEHVLPPYYGTAETRADQPCNAEALANTNENWTISDFIGLDTDGDHLYDEDDPDCQSLPPGTVSGTLSIVPPGGTVPFVASFQVSLTNTYLGQLRRLAGRIDARLASGTSFSNWRSGYTNVAPGVSFVKTWNQNIPASGALIGDNVFTLRALDVTPPPYNQPPYPPAGDSASSTATLQAFAP